MEYIRILGVKIESNLRSFNLSQETLLKIGVAVAVVIVVGMLLWRRGK